MKIVVVGLGYVGLANALILAQNNQVIGVDKSEKKVRMLNRKENPILDEDISSFFANRIFNFKATTDLGKAIKKADFIIIATPTNYDERKNYFDTSSIEEVIKLITVHLSSVTHYKIHYASWFCDKVRNESNNNNIFFSPSFYEKVKPFTIICIQVGLLLGVMIINQENLRSLVEGLLEKIFLYFYWYKRGRNDKTFRKYLFSNESIFF